MKRLIIVCLMLFIAVGLAAVEQDKVLHATISTGICITTHVMTAYYHPETTKYERYAIDVAVCAGVGVLKESLDAKFSWEDMAANGIGCGVGLVLMEILEPIEVYYVPHQVMIRCKF